ncbi:MAG: hypothetical protein JXR91_10790 [Deltaproteobacteria bacterium]|nr:hypothetical protein [Deltaproteobacteria bacterium]
MDEDILEKLHKSVTEFYEGLPEDLSWSFDGRFYGALCEFETTKLEAITKILEASFGKAWDTNSIYDAPELVQIISDFTGGLRGDQLLYTSSQDTTPLVFAALWPWGNGETVSLRLIPTAQNATPEEMKDLLVKFKGWMNI